jgi:hypothetical protein
MASGAIISGYMGSKATKEAAEQSAAAIREATAEARRQYDDSVARFEPFYKVGTNAIGDYEKMLYGGYDMQESPAAQYQLQSGTKAMNRALASRGLSGSGNAVNRLTELNSSIAATDWNNQYTRLLNSLKIGTGAASEQNDSSDSYSNTVSNNAANLARTYTNEAKQLSSIYGKTASDVTNSIGNMFAVGTKSGWWGNSG